ncbi:hypothetical protein COK01_27715 [Priestia megaterium]|jgi:hypothetical protein|uniref:Uncharacterized protein n=1 Tax=Priestia megaterium TaxID=1404 RepID=A0A2A8W2P2_PRIMG|nr:hypothetical protein AZK53_10610 [Priestia megaterium]AVX08276.1 hypothetical protein CS527_11370 [Bacillus sp. Y-01]KOP74436.1 hypothetical protein AMS61_08865 [Bacillus sp. FJAT-21351]KQU19906.1 hypothetical protein ASG61_06265 [Bacillus sp. Leaf75]MBG9931212.1 hypothetical protein [Priestia aryabhattai]RFB29801.1 hypothetical protein DZB87_04795 [Bacillus sp. ALD]RFB40798.1 hypothetical protein DZB86_08175 [Bacillus sp. RC]
MHLFLSFLIICAGIIWMEIKRLPQHSHKKERNIFIVFMTISIIIALAKIFRLPLPNPSDWVEVMFQPLSHLLFRWIT